MLQWLINMNSRASALHLNHWPSEVDNRAISERVLKRSIFVKYVAGLLVFQCDKGYSWPLLTFAFRSCRKVMFYIIFQSCLNFLSPLHWYHLKVCSRLFCLLMACSTVSSVWYNELSDWFLPDLNNKEFEWCITSHRLKRLFSSCLTPFRVIKSEVDGFPPLNFHLLLTCLPLRFIESVPGSHLASLR